MNTLAILIFLAAVAGSGDYFVKRLNTYHPPKRKRPPGGPVSGRLRETF